MRADGNRQLRPPGRGVRGYVILPDFLLLAIWLILRYRDLLDGADGMALPTAFPFCPRF